MSAILYSLLIFVVGGALSVAAFWAMVQWRKPPASEASKELANAVAFRVGAIHALVLGLMFGWVVVENIEAEQKLEEGVVLLGKLALLYEMPEDEAHLNLISRYAEAILDEGLNPRTKRTFSASNQILEELIALVFTDVRNGEARATVAQELVTRLYELGTLRALELEETVPVVFWFFGIIGFFATLYPMTVHGRSRFGFEVIFIYGGVIALILFLIFEASTPFSYAIRIETDTVKELIKHHGLRS